MRTESLKDLCTESRGDDTGRMSHGFDAYRAICRRDARRLRQAKIILKSRFANGPPLDASEMRYTAELYLHSESREDIAMSYYLGWQANKLVYPSTHEERHALHIAAQARDKLQQLMGLPQDFGTVWVRDSGGALFQWELNPDFTGSDRNAWFRQHD